jgi:hypothetical membrane protein
MTATAEFEGRDRTTRALLALGFAAGPIYLIVGALQIMLRPGFDVTRHPLSMMANGDLGWVQVANFLVTAVLLMAGALGLLRSQAGRGHRISAVLLFLYGLSLVGAGMFKADPGAGFPPGTPDAVTISAQGLMHFGFGGIGFLAFIAAALIQAGVHFKSGDPAWGWFSALTGVGFFGAFLGIASGPGSPTTVLAFYAAIVLAFVWLSATFARVTRSIRQGG